MILFVTQLKIRICNIKITLSCIWIWFTDKVRLVLPITAALQSIASAVYFHNGVFYQCLQMFIILKIFRETEGAYEIQMRLHDEFSPSVYT